MNDKQNDSGSIKRSDFKLRLEYYGLKTHIYLLKTGQYAIQLLNYPELYDEIKENFEHTIRQVGDDVELIIEKPDNIREEITPIKNTADNQGLFLNNEMLQSLLVSRFTDIDFRKIEVDFQNGVCLKLILGHTVSKEKEKEVKTFLLDMKNGFTDVEIQIDEHLSDPILIKTVDLACTDSRYKFSIEDSEFWFSNAQKIYSGNLTRESLRFFDPEKTKCYMDFSIWQNRNVNIRSAVLLYDTVYIAFPLQMNFEKFLEQQHLTVKDLYTLIENQKLVILLPNTESRYDKNILDEMYGMNPNCIVSKRGINALMAMYYCELEKQYMKIWKGKEEVLKEFCMDCAKKKDPLAKMFADMLLWPIRAKNESYELLTSYSPLSVSSIGVNNYLLLPQHNKSNIEFEMTVNAPAIHIATALHATYFPFCIEQENGSYSDLGVATLLGDILNMYNYLGKNQLEHMKEYSERVNKKNHSICLLRSENTVDLKHILDYEKKYHTSHTLKKILEDLAFLDDKKCEEKIKEYNNAIAEAGMEKAGIGTILNYMLSVGGFLPGAGTAFSIAGLFTQILNDLGIKEKKTIARIENGTASEKDKIFLLDKVNRVAHLERSSF